MQRAARRPVAKVLQQKVLQPKEELKKAGQQKATATVSPAHLPKSMRRMELLLRRKHQKALELRMGMELRGWRI